MQAAAGNDTATVVSEDHEMRFTPAEIVAGYCAMIGSPFVALMIIGSDDPWDLKAVALASLAGLLLHTIRRLKAEA